jgi:hypothetical protein
MKQLGGPNLSDVLYDNSSGTYIPVYNFAEEDTVWAWVEHVEEGTKPDLESAKRADLVIWCYPQQNPHWKHVSPKGRGKIYIVRQGDLFWVTDEKPN